MTGPLAILGPGTLGLSTAQWAAECGLEVRLLGRTLEHAEAGFRRIKLHWQRAADAGRLSLESMTSAQALITPAPFSPAALQGIATFLEAVPESPDAKVPVLAQASRWGNPDLLILTGTSALPVSALAREARLEGRLVGFHLFVPVPRMGVVEMAVAPYTEQVWVDRTRALGQAFRKRVVQVRDQPGFAAARMALAQGLEAMRLLEAGVATAEDLDALMTLGYGHPLGPLELSDRVGLDLRLRIAEGLVAAGEPGFNPPPILSQKVRDGFLGRKTSQGFHMWGEK
ncbi:MAG TPA: 3-hydroxyacyl-CoA dehydrogenase family protein [Geothrix sp.]|nr:3-hydroxyacyl-CoA dehydrogenase family protein [Geothrix sp.]